MSTTTASDWPAEAGESGHANMAALCNSFPVLRGRPGTDPWNAERFALAMKGVSNAEKQAAAFVLGVWAGTCREKYWLKGEFKVAEFDVVYAFQIWDYQQQAAFLTWCQNPFFP
jgi:hypothetical protein